MFKLCIEEGCLIVKRACRCGGSCNQLSTCGTQLDDGYCYTPDTQSILVGNY